MTHGLLMAVCLSWFIKTKKNYVLVMRKGKGSSIYNSHFNSAYFLKFHIALVPSSNLTINEQLLPRQTRCPFILH